MLILEMTGKTVEVEMLLGENKYDIRTRQRSRVDDISRTQTVYMNIVIEEDDSGSRAEQDLQNYMIM